MHSPALALTWQGWWRHRRGLTVCAAVWLAAGAGAERRPPAARAFRVRDRVTGAGARLRRPQLFLHPRGPVRGPRDGVPQTDVHLAGDDADVGGVADAPGGVGNGGLLDR